ncbi:MAG: hypothetical protein ACRDO8_06455, partial [Nocardioidaceae bacterium]
MSPRALAVRGERLARLRLSAIVEPGDARVPRLLASHSAEDLLESVRAGCLPGGEALPEAWRLRAADATLRAQEAADRARAASMRWICPGDTEWPERLGDLDHGRPVNGVGGAPLGLWARGAQDLAE